MAQASQLSPELGRSLLQVARALLVAARNWSLYPPEHPSVTAAVRRLGEAIHESSLGTIFSIGITPETLMIEGTAADAGQAGIAEAAALLHDRDLLRITFIGDIPPLALHAFLRVLTLETAKRRQRGGPAQIWMTGRRLRAFKERSVAALEAIGTPKAGEALSDAAKTGDRKLRTIVAALAN